MRRSLLGGSLLALILITCLLWAYRFERVEGLPSWGFAEIRAQAPEVPGLVWSESQNGPALKVFVGTGNSKVGAKLAIPGVIPSRFLHLQFRLSASALKAGAQPWEDGRLMVDWHSTGDRTNVETDPVGTIRDDIRGDFQDIVVGSENPPAIPTLRVEHLGRSGEFTISELKIEVIRERQVWRIGRWLLFAGWWCWAFAFIRCWPRVKMWRVALAGGLWVLMGVQSVMPGPWKIQRPIYPKFQLGPESSIQRESPADPVAEPTLHFTQASGELKPLGEMPIQGSFILKLKLTIQQARPLFHLMMLFAPMLGLSLLVGNRPAFWLSSATAISIELAQVAFGYGFGWDDIGDLVCDFAGIALAAWLAERLTAWLRKRYPECGFLHAVP